VDRDKFALFRATGAIGRSVGAFLIAASLAQASSVAGAAEPPKTEPTFDELKQEMASLELQLDTLWRRVPKCDPAEEKHQLAVWAKTTGELESFDVKPVAEAERLRLEDGRPTPMKLLRMEISGREPYERVDVFLSRIAQRPRLMDLETLRLRAEAGGTVSFAARFALPCYSDEENPAPVGSTPEMLLADHLSWLLGTYQKVEELTARADTSRLALALGAFGREIGNSAVTLTEVRSAQEIVLEGVVSGASSRTGLEPALKRAGFQVGNVQTSPAEECQKFSITARLDPGEPDQERAVVLRNGLFDNDTAAFCASRPSLGKVVAHGAQATPEGRALTLRMRDVELVHLFLALHDLTREEFVVDPDVQGRVSVEVEGATIEETLAAMSSVGVAVGPGPLRRVSRAASRPAAAPSHAPYTGEKITVSLQDSDLATFLCMFEQISQRKISAPRELAGRLSIFVEYLPWDQIFDGALTSAGLVSKPDGDRLWGGTASAAKVRGRSKAVDVCQIPDSGPPSRLAPQRSLPEMRLADLELAGLGRGGGDWKAYAYSPWRTFLSLEAGLKLQDASVKSVGPTGVAFVSDASEVVEVPFQR
jgi:hypothetical protein